MKKHNIDFPLVSICIPAYNAERFIQDTLESALAQDYPNLEIIVSDDCSSDQTREVVKEYRHRGVDLYCQEKNLGMHANWNAVIRASHGKYAVKLDADDLLEPEYVSSMVAVMENHSKITFAHCACRLIDVNGNFLGYERSIHGSFIRNGLHEWPRYVFGPRAVNIVMIRRSAYDAVGGYDEKFKYSGDWKMHRDLLKIGDVFYNDKVLASYRVHALGKRGIRLLQAKEHLMHLEDMAHHWPPEVPGKNCLLAKTRRQQAMGVARALVCAEPDEIQEISRYLPLYGNYWGPRLLAWLGRNGWSDLLRSYWHLKGRLRQAVKQLLYKPADSPINVPTSFIENP